MPPGRPYLAREEPGGGGRGTIQDKEGLDSRTILSRLCLSHFSSPCFPCRPKRAQRHHKGPEISKHSLCRARPRDSPPRHKFDKTKGFPGEGPFGFNFTSANVIPWGSFREARTNGFFQKIDVLALQEHKLCTQSKIDEAAKFIQKHDMRGGVFLHCSKKPPREAIQVG